MLRVRAHSAGTEHGIIWRPGRNVTANLFDDPGKLMTRYPRQVDREYLSCRSGGLNKIQMIDGGTLYLHQDLVACDRRRRYIVEHQLPTVFQQSDSFHASSPCSSAKFTPCDVRSTMGSLVSAPIWSRVAACPVGELREHAAELAFQAGDVGAVADALEPLQHHRDILAVLPDLFDWRLRERNRPTQRLRQDLRRLQHRSYVTGKIDLAAVQGGGVGERARAEPADVVHRNHL